MQAFGVAAAFEDPPGELVDNLDLTVLHQIVDIAPEKGRRPQRLHEVVDELAGEILVDVVDPQLPLDAGQPLLGDGHGALLLVDLVVRLFALAGREPAGDAGEIVVGLGRPFAWPRDDERGPRLIDEDGVHLVHDAVVVAALHLLVGPQDHVVAQIVEAELGVGAIGDVGLVGGPPFVRFHAVLQRGHRHTQELIHGAHPGRVAPGQIVVDGDQMDAPPGEGVKVYG